MSWSSDTMVALKCWLGPGTVFSRSPHDEARFYSFVAHVWNDCRSLWNETEAVEIIRSEVESLHPKIDVTTLEQFAEKRMSQGTFILDFLCSVRDDNNWNLLDP